MGNNVLAPLYWLLPKETKWSWGDEQQRAFQEVKKLLTSECLLVHFDPDKELILACDASPYGVGAVLSHRSEDGREQPIAFASRSLAAAEKKYSQLEKEGLAIVFGVKKFYQYLFGRHFIISSDHKPLQHIFKETSATPTMASARVQRWALLLGAYNYTIRYKPGKLHANADMLSRLPLPQAPERVPVPPETIHLMDAVNSSPVTASHIKQWTSKDPMLSKVKDLVLRGHYGKEESIAPYQRFWSELSVQDGCLLRGNRIVVPPEGRDKVMELLHSGHPGNSRMKSLARSFVWWPGIDHDLEEKVKRCDACQRVRHNPAPAPLHPWEFPRNSWECLHADFAGPFLGKMFLIVIDAYSKWLEVKPLTAATSAIMIEHLRAMFATHGLLKMFVTDNGTQFTSAEFESFMKNNGIQHVKSSPYHPSSNGLAERAVQCFKEGMKKSSMTESLDTRISRFLFWYRLTPHSTTGVPPAELLLGRIPRSQLDLLKPQLSSKVQQKQDAQKKNHDVHSKQREFRVGDIVFVRDFPSGKRWLTGSVTEVRGPLSYHITLSDGRVVRRHIDHIRIRTSSVTDVVNDSDIEIPIAISSQPSHDEEPEQSDTNQPQVEQPHLRQSTRARTQPDYLRY